MGLSDRGEQQGLSDLYAGGIATFKNPSGHRAVEFEDPVEAAEVVAFASLLLRMLDRSACDGCPVASPDPDEEATGRHRQALANTSPAKRVDSRRITTQCAALPTHAMTLATIDTAASMT